MSAAVRRTVEELGAAPELLRGAGTVTYQLEDQATGLVEHEFNHVFIGAAPADLAPDPEEVASTRYVDPTELAELTSQHELSVWFATVWAAAAPLVGTLGLPGGADLWKTP